ncbi:MAG: hypothetical protein ABSB41_18415 [Anaerolineales bacterium]
MNSVNWSDGKGYCLGRDQRLGVVQLAHRLQTEVAPGNLPFIILLLEDL